MKQENTLQKYLLITYLYVFLLSAISFAQEDIIINSEDFGDRLKIGYVWSGDLSFNPLQINSDYDKDFADLVFGDGLFTINNSGHVVSNLALESKLLNPTILRVKLRPNLTFHDGSILDADDVKLSYELYKKHSERSQFLYNAGFINSIEVYGSDIVWIVLEKPLAEFSETIGQLPIMPSAMSKVLLNYNSISDLPYVNPVGFGNFQFAEYKQNQSVKLDSYKNHTLGRSFISGIDFIFYETQDRLLNAFLREEVDLIQISDKSEIQKIIQFSKKIVQTEDENRNLYYINLNTNKAPFNDFGIRKAVNYAINKDQVIENLFYKNGKTTANDYRLNYSSESKYFTPIEYKPLDALQILFNNQFKKNSQGKLVKNNKELQFELYIRKGSIFEESIARIIAINLGDIGINVIPISIESENLNKKILTGQYQAVLKKFNYNPNYEITTLRNFYFNELNNQNGTQNFKHLSFDLLIDHITKTKSEKYAQNIQQRFQNLLNRYSPCLFLFFKDSDMYAINPRFENIITSKKTDDSKSLNYFKPKHEWFVKKINHKY